MATVSPPHPGDRRALTREFARGAGGRNAPITSQGDEVLIEEPTYSGALAAIAPLGCRLVGVPTDANGIIPEKLEQLLQAGTSAKVLYTIPTGQNPSGCTTTAARRQEVYALAAKHDLLIMEDDPYYYLYLDAGGPPPSYFSMDTDGRVIRMESFSKVPDAGPAPIPCTTFAPFLPFGPVRGPSLAAAF